MTLPCPVFSKADESVRAWVLEHLTERPEPGSLEDENLRNPWYWIRGTADASAEAWADTHFQRPSGQQGVLFG